MHFDFQGETYSVRFQAKNQRGKDKNGKWGKFVNTTAVLYNVKTGEVVSTGLARCHWSDIPSPARGRMLAFQRLFLKRRSWTPKFDKAFRRAAYRGLRQAWKGRQKTGKIKQAIHLLRSTGWYVIYKEPGRATRTSVGKPAALAA